MFLAFRLLSRDGSHFPSLFQASSIRWRSTSTPASSSLLTYIWGGCSLVTHSQHCTTQHQPCIAHYNIPQHNSNNTCMKVIPASWSPLTYMWGGCNLITHSEHCTTQHNTAQHITTCPNTTEITPVWKWSLPQVLCWPSFDIGATSLYSQHCATQYNTTPHYKPVQPAWKSPLIFLQLTSRLLLTVTFLSLFFFSLWMYKSWQAWLTVVVIKLKQHLHCAKLIHPCPQNQQWDGTRVLTLLKCSVSATQRLMTWSANQLTSCWHEH